MDDVFKKNRDFIESKRRNLVTLAESLYLDVARSYRRRYHSAPSPYEIAEMYREICSAEGDVFVSPDFAIFCRAFAEVFGGAYSSLTRSEKDDSPPKAAYLQNTFSDRAYRRFSEQFERMSAVYFPGFGEVCEEVYNGGCSYAILPIHNSRDGQLVSFRRLILRYDLKISLVTDIETNDDSSMRFALLKKGIDNDRRNYLDLSLVLDNSDYAPFLSACEALGAAVIMLSSLPLEYSDDRYGLSLQLDVRNSSRDSLLCFLEGSRIRYDIVGFYDIIKP